MSRRLPVIVLVLSFALFVAKGASPQGHLFVPDPEKGTLQPLVTKLLKVTFEATESLATTRVKQTFYNPTSRIAEGRFIFPLPKGTAVSKFAIWAGNKRLQAQVRPKDDAKRVYDDIVRRMRDPALLQYVGSGLFEARVYPIEPNSDKDIEIEYSSELSTDGDVVEYIFPLNSSLVTQMPVMSFVIAGSIKSRDPVNNVYSPTHPIALHRENDNEASLSFESNDLRADRDFTVYYTVCRDEMGFSVLSHKEGNDGYFLLLAAPKYTTGETARPAKDVILALDISGSMQGPKLEQARKAAKHIISNLDRKDNFNLIVFNDQVRNFKEVQVPAEASQIKDAVEFLGRLEAAGGTDINGALTAALGMLKRENVSRMVIFLTDGHPTIGVTETSKIIENVGKANTSLARIYVFGVGYDVGDDLLDGIAKQSRGTVSYVLKDEDLERAIASFYNKVAYPVLCDLSLKISGIETFDTYPQALPDLFRGSQLVLYGRYSGGGNATVLMSGKVGNLAKHFEKTAVFAKEPGPYEFVPRLWALRRVGFLLDQIREKGELPELVGECVRLGTRYAIVTPYTSHLVTEDSDQIRPLPGWWQEQRDSVQRPQRQAPLSTSLDKGTYLKTMAAAPPAARGNAEEKINFSMALQELSDATAEKGQYTGTRKLVGKKTFVFDGNCWIDTAIDKSHLEKPDTVLKFLSDEYFEAIRKDEKLGKYLSVGKCVAVLYNGKLMKVHD